ncbi:MAG TPA: hypothetical protein VN025_11625 [Candidatus Dormibacteraeota bacterium]|jgi:hypothetical protein|nr:hypothetical protein [Candidatus Dormibacteraeota bacterium]
MKNWRQGPGGEMEIDAFYEENDASRLSRTLRLLAKHDISRWALTGGTAIELHLHQMGAPPSVRQLHDLDFIAASFDCLPTSLGDVLLSRHVHPHDPPAKTMLQAVDPGTSVRVDVFRAYGSELERTHSIKLAGSLFQIVAFEDLVARHARLCCDLLREQTLAPKFARDFLRLLDSAKPEHIENVWQEHRKLEDPMSFAETAALLRTAIAARTELLIPAVYSTDVDEVCPRCKSTAAFRLADARQVLALLGYC